ncbi:nucleoside hydrolase [Sabulicella glaciei]|uniref:Nucleoside hydrolase n=1 Tax=Sabulicella glaciei TaxID=2984948 RepID=A0ABT3P1M1_9PROT|nr:nucleoside hydrolase [Roseococcus sp. MDT2-1-1]MCW8088310.1 nucleoside hydrolase [Roseococcus sp. MDT2-1-1]
MRGAALLRLCSVAIAVLAGCAGSPVATPAPPSMQDPTSAATDRRADCVLVDSDAGLDDLRAIAVLAPHRRIAAVVATEGLATPRGGARALRAYLRGTGIPVVEGASPPPGRGPDPHRVRGLDGPRITAETLNGTLPAADPASQAGEAPAPSLEAEVERLTAGCERLDLLMIGPWTSFLRYDRAVVARLARVVAQGSPFPDDEARGQPDGWNCRYDYSACREAFARLGRRDLRADWVDIPQGARTCGSAEPGKDAAGRRVYSFTPDAEMAWAFAATPDELPRNLGRLMLHNPVGLERTSLWDDLAALYLLRPDIFGRVRDPSGRSGGHFEPCVPAQQVRDMLVAASAGPPSNLGR